MNHCQECGALTDDATLSAFDLHAAGMMRTCRPSASCTPPILRWLDSRCYHRTHDPEYAIARHVWETYGRPLLGTVNLMGVDVTDR